MAQQIIKSAKSLISEANQFVSTMSVEEAKKVFNHEDYVFVDLRDIRELKREGKIPGAFSSDASKFSIKELHNSGDNAPSFR